MPTDFQKLLETFQANAYDGMVEHLARHLGIQADPLRRLGLGWAPVVEFKKGKNYQGWWVIPERDAEGKVIGLSLRSSNDTKVMYPGSKHGLIYEPNPSHKAGGHGYHAGPGNWVRTMSVGIDCPICQKPDGCLLSSDNPADPKAVICIRVEAGSVQQLRFGYLHLRKGEAELSAASPLADNGGPIVVVEGGTDTAAARQLGFDGVGRPSNLACMDLLADLVRGRAVIVVGENDRKPNGDEPGREGMLAAFQTLKRVCKDIQWVMPPAHFKDLRAWVVKGGLDRAAFLGYIEKHGQRRIDQELLDDDRPITIAKAYLNATQRLGNRYKLRRWREEWYEFKHGRYQLIPEELAIPPIYKWAEDKQVQHEDKKGNVTLEKLHVSQNMRRNIQEAVLSETAVETNTVPCWINGAQGPDPAGLVVFNNGVLDVPTYLTDSSVGLRDLTPDLFSTSAVAVAFDPTALCHHWLNFLESSLGDEPDKINLLQEWIGYCMVPDTTMQKMMYMRGPTSSGKGTIIEIMCQLVGADQFASTSLTDLAGNFGLAPLSGKLMAIFPDVRTPRSWDAMRGLEVLLKITGSDRVGVSRKFKDPLEGTLSARITMASNEYLDVPDHAGALLRRLCILEFIKSFKDNPDTGLRARLAQELPGIAIWALHGLKRLRKNGAFTEPPSTLVAKEEWRVATSPIAAFIEECCDMEGECLKMELYDAWVGWSSERRLAQMSKGRFFERVRVNAPTVTSETYEQGVHKRSVFKGCTLKAWAARKFTGATN